MTSTDSRFERARALLRDRAFVVKAASFALVGLINTGVDLGVFSFAHFVLGWPIIAANVVAWLVAMSGSFVMNSFFTFAAESGRELRAKRYAAFFATQIIGLIGNTTTVFVASYFMPVLLGKVLAIGVSFSINFTLSHFVVFRRRHPRPGDAPTSGV